VTAQRAGRVPRAMYTDYPLSCNCRCVPRPFQVMRSPFAQVCFQMALQLLYMFPVREVIPVRHAGEYTLDDTQSVAVLRWTQNTRDPIIAESPHAISRSHGRGTPDNKRGSRIPRSQEISSSGDFGSSTDKRRSLTEYGVH